MKENNLFWFKSAKLVRFLSASGGFTRRGGAKSKIPNLKSKIDTLFVSL